MQKPNFAETVSEIVRRDKRYDRDAYFFVREGLDFTLKMLKKHTRTAPVQRHVSGQELLEGLRRCALEQFGPMARTVLQHWGIRRCEDFGEIVFNMVETGILGKQEHDSREDFRGGYDFEEAFVRPYQPTVPVPARSADRVHPKNEPRSRKSRSSSSKELSSGSN
jgi:uncharacterized repeat protein (TIGR04138 family)